MQGLIKKIELFGMIVKTKKELNMSLSKYRKRVDDLKPKECRQKQMSELLEEIKYSKNCFAIIQPNSGPVEVITTGLNEETLSSMTVLMCSDERVLKFLKLAVVSAEKFKMTYSKGMNFHTDALDHVSKNFSDYLPHKEKE